AFAEILGIDQIAFPAAQRDASHAHALAFQRQDFAPDETLADLRILIDQIGDMHVQAIPFSGTTFTSTFMWSMPCDCLLNCSSDISSGDSSPRVTSGTMRAGTPTAVAPSGTSCSTTDSAPMRQPLPMRTPPSTCA